MRRGGDVAADAEIRSAIQDHLTGFWPSSIVSEETWDQGPIHENVPGFRVLKLKSQTPNRPFLYVTLGCFMSAPKEHMRHEFFLISMKEHVQNVETLTMLANFHSDERYR